MKDDIIEELMDRVEENCKAIDTDELYDQMLDECYSFESVGGPFGYMRPSDVLKTMDPTAYRCDRNDWVDGEDITDVLGEDYSTRDLETVRDELLSELEDELSELDDEMEDLHPEVVPRPRSWQVLLYAGLDEPEDHEAKLEEKVALQAKIDKVRKYTF